MIKSSTDLIKYSDQGLYCELADTWIDPHKPVNRALITHAHMDHFTFGCNEYISTYETSVIIKKRIGSEINIKTYDYGQEFKITCGLDIGSSGITCAIGHVNPGNKTVKLQGISSKPSIGIKKLVPWAWVVSNIKSAFAFLGEISRHTHKLMAIQWNGMCGSVGACMCSWPGFWGPMRAAVHFGILQWAAWPCICTVQIGMHLACGHGRMAETLGAIKGPAGACTNMACQTTPSRVIKPRLNQKTRLNHKNPIKPWGEKTNQSVSTVSRTFLDRFGRFGRFAVGKY